MHISKCEVKFFGEMTSFAGVRTFLAGDVTKFMQYCSLVSAYKYLYTLSFVRENVENPQNNT